MGWTPHSRDGETVRRDAARHRVTFPASPARDTMAATSTEESAMASFIRSDLAFVLRQILIAEAHAAGTPLTELLPNGEIAWGLRTVDGSFNHIAPEQQEFGAADNT